MQHIDTATTSEARKEPRFEACFYRSLVAASAWLDCYVEVRRIYASISQNFQYHHLYLLLMIVKTKNSWRLKSQTTLTSSLTVKMTIYKGETGIELDGLPSNGVIKKNSTFRKICFTIVTIECHELLG